MLRIGKIEEYFYYKCSGKLDLLEYLPEYRPQDIIAGGAALHILNRSFPLKDIDIWSDISPPNGAKYESPFAFNYKKDDSSPNVQYMKIQYGTPSVVLDHFDLDCCKVAIYGINDNGYMMCVHQYIQPLVRNESPQGYCNLNQDSISPYTLSRLGKYAKKFGNSISGMFDTSDIIKAVKAYDDTITEVDFEKLAEYIDNNDLYEVYELLDHLQDLFTHMQPTERVDDFFDSVARYAQQNSRIPVGAPQQSNGLFATWASAYISPQRV